VIRPVAVATAAGERSLGELPVPLDLDALVAGDGPWEVELGFGKGRYLLRRAGEDPGRRFLGVEVASKYYRRLAERVARRGLANLIAVRGEAIYLLSAVLPRAFAAALHVYFPDPWPKSRHHKRRLFDPETVDLVLGLLVPGGRLCFATDFLDYGEEVAAILAGHPQVGLRRLAGRWPDGARTNYEAKYEREGRPILRLEATLGAAGAGAADGASLHPAGAAAVLAAVCTAPAESSLDMRNGRDGARPERPGRSPAASG
jgi:tRNA (guanine-N7-)-methyltransferase